jgi:hypothetical protein
MAGIATYELGFGYVTTLTGVVTLPNKKVFDPSDKSHTERELLRLSKEVPNLIWKQESKTPVEPKGTKK